MKGLIKVLKFISNHPISGRSKLQSILRFTWWQFRCMLTDKDYHHQFTEHSKLIVSKGMTGATGNLYCGLHEYKEMMFLLHYLRKNETFVDIGANIGSFTLLASAEIVAKSYSIEPVSSTFQQLSKNILLNKISDLCILKNIGLASQKGELFFSNGDDSSMNHVLLNNEESNNSSKVIVDTLDSILINSIPTLLKIDVEGFELEVLKGASKTLSNPELKAIIIELNRSGSIYGYSDAEIDMMLKDLGFESYTYEPFQRSLMKAMLHDFDNLIYIRDFDIVSNKLKSATKVKILNLEI